jgi:hypothetical protein
MSSEVSLSVIADGSGRNAADVALHERAQVIGDVVDREQRQPGEFVGEDPQPHLVEFDLPVGGEGVDVRRHEHERRRGTWNREVVDAEGPPGEVADHRADAHAHHRRRHHLAEAGHHLGHRVGGHLGRQVVGATERRGESVNNGR